MKRILQKIWRGWKRFARKFGQVQAEIILFLFYFLIFTPYGIFLKSLGHDPLKIRERQDSTWQNLEPRPFDLEKLKRQS